MLQEQVEEILTLVAQRRGIDFRDYRREALLRRAELRVQATGCADLGTYCSYVAAFHVVLCRNVLLYFKDSLRATAAERLAAVLEPEGVLTFGASEALPGKVATLFEPYPGVAVGAGIFRRSGA